MLLSGNKFTEAKKRKRPARDEFFNYDLGLYFHNS